MAHPAPDRRGFTIVELLVAMVITSLLVGVIFQLIQGQGRYVSVQSSKEEVQQNSRAAVELIGSELRTVPGGNGIEVAKEDEISIRAARFWGVVCVGTNGGNTVTLRMPKLAGASYALNLGTRFAANVGDNELTPEWTSSPRVTAIGNPITTPPASCRVANQTVLPAGVEVRQITLSGLPLGSVLGNEPQPGDPAYVYDLVTYGTGPSSTGGEWILRRIGNEAGSRNQPMAGPVPPGGGLSFTYFAGSTEVAAPVSDAAARSTIDRLMMVVETVSRNQMNGVRQSKTDTVMVSLRNRVQ